MDPPSRGDEGRWLISRPEFDREVRAVGIHAFEPSHDHVAQPVGSKVIVAPRPGHQRPGPPPEGIYRLVEILPPRRQGVAPVVQPTEHTAVLQAPEALDEQVGGDAGQAAQKLVVTARAFEQLANHE